MHWKPYVTPAYDTVCDGCNAHAFCDICHHELGHGTRFYFKNLSSGRHVVHASCVEETTPRGTRERKRSAEIKAIVLQNKICDACGQ